MALFEGLGHLAGCLLHHLGVDVVDEAASVKLDEDADYFVELEGVENSILFLNDLITFLHKILLLTHVSNIDQIQRKGLVI